MSAHLSSLHPSAARCPPWRAPTAAPDDAGFARLREALRPSGGLSRVEDFARLLEDYRLAEFVGLARRIATGQVFVLEWRHAVWLPMFQYDLRDLTLRASTAQVRAALGPDVDGWAAAHWFVASHAALGGHTPLALLATDLPAVLRAALGASRPSPASNLTLC